MDLHKSRRICFAAERLLQVLSNKNPKLVIDAYKDATRLPYTYLFMDFTQKKTEDFLRTIASFTSKFCEILIFKSHFEYIHEWIEKNDCV